MLFILFWREKIIKDHFYLDFNTTHKKNKSINSLKLITSTMLITLLEINLLEKWLTYATPMKNF